MFDIFAIINQVTITSRAQFAENLNYLCISTGLADRAISQHGYAKTGKAVKFARLYQLEIENGQHVMDGVNTALEILADDDPIKRINDEELHAMNELLHRMGWKYAGNIDYYLRTVLVRDSATTHLVNKPINLN